MFWSLPGSNEGKTKISTQRLTPGSKTKIQPFLDTFYSTTKSGHCPNCALHVSGAQNIVYLTKKYMYLRKNKRGWKEGAAPNDAQGRLGTTLGECVPEIWGQSAASWLNGDLWGVQCARKVIILYSRWSNSHQILINIQNFLRNIQETQPFHVCVD